MSNFKKYLVEFIGTAVLVILVCGISALNEDDVLLTSVTAGLAIIFLMYIFGEVSGCHLNPAVSLGFFISGKMKVKDFSFYVLAQFLGALLGGALISLILRGTSLGINEYAPPEGSGDLFLILIGLGVEIVMTMIFVFVFLTASHKSEKKNNGLIIGACLTVVTSFAMPFTNAGLNPAKSFGVAFFGTIAGVEQLWLFILAPFIGAVLASLFYRLMYRKND